MGKWDARDVNTLLQSLTGRPEVTDHAVRCAAERLALRLSPMLWPEDPLGTVTFSEVGAALPWRGDNTAGGAR